MNPSRHHHVESAERQQAELFDRIAADYAAHYSDESSQRYRHSFFNEPMLGSVDLRGKRVLEAMCGTGQTTEYLLSKGAHVTGLDISEEMVASFKRTFGDRCDAICRSVLDTKLPDASFDAVVIVGGLHHVHPHVPQAIDEVYRVLKPGGWFGFIEPHAGSLPDLGRRIWYRFDDYFEDNEASVNLETLASANAGRFRFEPVQYFGNIAYLFVYNSLIFRAPKRLKQLYAGPLLAVEARLQPLMTRRFSCYAVSRWQKIAR